MKDENSKSQKTDFSWVFTESRNSSEGLVNHFQSPDVCGGLMVQSTVRVSKNVGATNIYIL